MSENKWSRPNISTEVDPSQEQQEPLNLLKDLERVSKALTELEGAEWFEKQKGPQWREKSIKNAVECSQRGKISVIFGNQGYRRYQVDETGEVSYLSKTGSGKQDDQKARAAGFKVV